MMSDTAVTIAETLLAAREALGLSVRDVGEAVGCSVGTVRSWEQGNSVPDESLVPALAALLQLDASALRRSATAEAGAPDAPVPPRAAGPTENPFSQAAQWVVTAWKRRRALARAPVASPSYLEDDRQVSAYRLRAVLTAAGVVIMLVVLRWAWGQFAEAISALFDTLTSVV